MRLLDLLEMDTTPYPHEMDIWPLLPDGGELDKAGNIFYPGDPDSQVLLVAHLDTADHGTPQKTRPIRRSGLIYSDGGPLLGADDRAGIYAISKMMRCGYSALFTVGEEVGCIGAGAFSPPDNRRWNLCIEIDRKGCREVITHQRGQRLCSDETAYALCDALDMGHTPSDAGLWTDNSELFPWCARECINIAAGYFDAHSPREYLIEEYITSLTKRLMTIDLETIASNGREIENNDNIKNFDESIWWLEGWRSNTHHIPERRVSSKGAKGKNNALRPISRYFERQ